MRVHDSFRPAGRARRVENHRQAVGTRTARRERTPARASCATRRTGSARSIRRTARAPARDGAASHTIDRRAGIREHVAQAIGGIARIQDDVELCRPSAPRGSPPAPRRRARTARRPAARYRRCAPAARAPDGSPPHRATSTCDCRPASAERARSPCARTCSAKRSGIDCSIASSGNARKPPTGSGRNACRSFIAELGGSGEVVVYYEIASFDIVGGSVRFAGGAISIARCRRVIVTSERTRTTASARQSPWRTRIFGGHRMKRDAESR